MANMYDVFEKEAASNPDLKWKDLEGTTYMRLLEMTLENSTTKMNDVPLMMQFFQDLKVYGLNEAIAYAESYEKQGHYEIGTATKLRDVKAKAIARLQSKMGGKNKKVVLDDFKLEDLANRLIKAEQMGLPTVGDTDDNGERVKATIEWADQFATLARVSQEVAYVWAEDYWVPEAVDPALKAKADEIKLSGRVIIDL